MIGGKYKNIALVTIVLGGFVLFMIVTTAWVVYDVSKGRSCVKTCEKKEKKANEETKNASSPIPASR
ncbi:hypothetical protein [Hydrogenimonas urashimensis]|uniref:hypothetical protein n=1 Tax=Hydrogenimonas urashimensis TaxID=2740515 RepID=UPI001915B3DE|nr:hypothetical protein [Hydrogenimonas urashimensis]